MRCQPPPADLAELGARAAALVGASLADLAHGLGGELGADPVRTKGHAGELLEHLLGATGGPTAVHDFPHLGVELKTVPVTPLGRPRESTFVCLIPLLAAGDVPWADSRVRRKLAHVLFVPLVAPSRVGTRRASPDGFHRGRAWEPFQGSHISGAGLGDRRVGPPLFWRPTPVQERALKDDYDDLMGLVGVGGIEEVSGHAGRILQVRPKAASSRCRAFAPGPEGEWLATVPRGFYLRARFVAALLRDPTALP